MRTHGHKQLVMAILGFVMSTVCRLGNEPSHVDEDVIQLGEGRTFLQQSFSCRMVIGAYHFQNKKSYTSISLPLACARASDHTLHINQPLSFLRGAPRRSISSHHHQ